MPGCGLHSDRGGSGTNGTKSTTTGHHGAEPELTFRPRQVLVMVVASKIEAVVNRIDCGDRFDAVVSSDDASLAMTAGVAGAIRASAGNVVQQEAQKLAPARLGDVLVTSAGLLPVRYIFHAVTLDVAHGLWPTDLTVRSIGESIFSRSEEVRPLDHCRALDRRSWVRRPSAESCPPCR